MSHFQLPLVGDENDNKSRISFSLTFTWTSTSVKFAFHFFLFIFLNVTENTITSLLLLSKYPPPSFVLLFPDFTDLLCNVQCVSETYKNRLPSFIFYALLSFYSGAF